MIRFLLALLVAHGAAVRTLRKAARRAAIGQARARRSEEHRGLQLPRLPSLAQVHSGEDPAFDLKCNADRSSLWTEYEQTQISTAQAQIDQRPMLVWRCDSQMDA